MLVEAKFVAAFVRATLAMSGEGIRDLAFPLARAAATNLSCRLESELSASTRARRLLRPRSGQYVPLPLPSGYDTIRSATTRSAVVTFADNVISYSTDHCERIHEETSPHNLA